MLALRKESETFLISLTKSVEQLKHMPLLQVIVAKDQNRIQVMLLGPLHVYDIIMSLLYASLTSQLEVLSLLMGKHHEMVPPYFVNFVLELAADRKLFDMMTPLLAHYDPQLLKDSPIVSTLIEHSKLELALRLITDGVLTESRDQRDQALYLSLKHRAPFLEEAILNEVNHVSLSYLYSNALIWAANDSNLNIVATCLKKGADIHIQDDLSLALASNAEDWPMVKLLIKAGADMTIKNHLAFFMAFVTHQEDVLQMYQTKFERKELLSSILVHLTHLGDERLLETALNDTDTDVTFHDSEALKIALAERNPSMIHLFVKYGADVSVNDYQLLYLCRCVPELQYLEDKALGASSNATDALSNAFCHAVMHNNTAVVSVLRKKGALPDFEDCACLQRAAAENNFAAVKLLLSRYGRVRPNVNSSVVFYYAELHQNQDMIKLLWEKVVTNGFVIVRDILYHALVAADRKTFAHVVKRYAFDFTQVPREQLEDAILISIRSNAAKLGLAYVEAYNPPRGHIWFFVNVLDALAHANSKFAQENNEMAEIRKLLTARFRMTGKTIDNSTLELIVQGGNYQLAAYLAKYGLAHGETLLTLAARFNQPKVAEHLIFNAGVDPTFALGAFTNAVRNQDWRLFDLMRIAASPHWSLGAVAAYAEQNNRDAVAKLIFSHLWNWEIERDYAWNNYYWVYRFLMPGDCFKANTSHDMLCGVLFWSVVEASRQLFEQTLYRLVKEQGLENPACANAVYEAVWGQKEAFAMELMNAGLNPDWFCAAREYDLLVSFFNGIKDDDHQSALPVIRRITSSESGSERVVSGGSDHARKFTRLIDLSPPERIQDPNVAHLVLMLAVKNVHRAMVDFLIFQGATDPGGVALMRAVSLPETTLGIVHALVTVSNVWANDCESLVQAILSRKLNDEIDIVYFMLNSDNDKSLADWKQAVLAVLERDPHAL